MAEKKIADIDMVAATLAASVGERWIGGTGDREEAIPGAMADLYLKVRAALTVATKGAQTRVSAEAVDQLNRR